MLALRSHGRLMLTAADFDRLRLRRSGTVPQTVNGEAWYALDALPGTRATVDGGRQVLAIDTPAASFDRNVLGPDTRPDMAATGSPPGGFFNYDLTFTHQDGRTQPNSLFELGGFAGDQSVLGRFLWRNDGDTTPGASTGRGAIRLDTTWTDDVPARRASLRVGDTIGGSGSWGPAIRLGGVQWATNFSTQPSLITFPQPTMSGEAAVPSSVDVYVNDALRLRRTVPAGPFTLQDLPVISGEGEARIVVRELLGRGQVITTPYYASPRLLRAGLHEFAYEGGFIRRDYGDASNRYGRVALLVAHRLGITDTLTGEARAELLGDQQTVGVGGARLWPAAGVFSASPAGSTSDAGAGGLLGAGLERQMRRLSLGARMQTTSDRFRQVGLTSVLRDGGVMSTQPPPASPARCTPACRCPGAAA